MQEKLKLDYREENWGPQASRQHPLPDMGVKEPVDDSNHPAFRFLASAPDTNKQTQAIPTLLSKHLTHRIGDYNKGLSYATKTWEICWVSLGNQNIG